MLTKLKEAVKLHPPFRFNFGSLMFIPWFGLFLAVHLVGLTRDKVLEHLPLFCPFETITGIPCPGCGMTRAFLALAEADFLSAFHFNPFSIPLFAFVLLSAFKVRLPFPQKIRGHLLNTVFAVIVLWWFWTRLLPGVL